MELSLNWNPSVLEEKSRAFALKRSLRKLECITGYPREDKGEREGIPDAHPIP